MFLNTKFLEHFALRQRTMNNNAPTLGHLDTEQPVTSRVREPSGRARIPTQLKVNKKYTIKIKGLKFPSWSSKWSLTVRETKTFTLWPVSIFVASSSFISKKYLFKIPVLFDFLIVPLPPGISKCKTDLSLILKIIFNLNEPWVV